MKVAAACYPIDWHDSWSGYEEKLRAWVAEAAGEGADLLVFPELAAMELASLEGAEAAADVAGSIRFIDAQMPKVIALHKELAAQHGVHVLGASGPVMDEDGPVNRAMFYTPDGLVSAHDKQILTLWERDPMHLVPGRPLTLIETALGRIGVLICYDSEFPLLARALVEAGAELLLVPSATDAPEGFTRVRVGAMARALEGQCVVVHAPTQGEAAWNPILDTNAGCAAVYGPPDRGFPASGILAEGPMDTPGWTYAEVDLEAVRTAREAGNVRTMRHWEEQAERLRPVEKLRLA